VNSKLDIYIVSGARTAIGTFGGGLSSLRPAELGTIVMKEAIARAGIRTIDVQNVVVGNVVLTQPKDVYVSRVAAVNAGVSIETPAMNVNRLCGSGLQAVISAAQGIALGEQDVALAGGAESMSNAPLLCMTARNGQKMGDQVLVDAMLGALHDPFGNMHMGVTAENVAERCGISRETQDQAAVESHRRAINAIQNGYFKEQIVPVEIKTRKGASVFDTDEHARADANIESMAGLKPVFKKDGTVTAGNASGINDGAGGAGPRQRQGGSRQRPEANGRILAWGHAGVDPRFYGTGSGQGGSDRSATGRADARPDGPGRSERGFRGTGLRRRTGTRLRSRHDQPEWIGDQSRPPDRRDRCNPDGQSNLRAQALRWKICTDHYVHRRRPGNRHGHRTRLSAARRTNSRMIKSLLIANRGEIACRVIRTARRLGIRTIAVYSEADARALHVKLADEAIHIGASPTRESYLVGEKILAAAVQTEAEAIHPGYGFLSENAEFAQAVMDAGIVWVGPKPASITAMGLKDAAKMLMMEAGVPCTPGYLGDNQDQANLATEAGKIGYPVLIKAVAGGGGKGMRLVETAEDFDDALASCQREASASFGNAHVLIEKYILSPRHIEVQVFGDSHGNVVHLFERDCSLQRRHQKVIEEAPAPGMDTATREAVCAAAVPSCEGRRLRRRRND
jgi:acetyl-CoA acetyltransferase family protein